MRRLLERYYRRLVSWHPRPGPRNPRSHPSRHPGRPSRLNHLQDRSRIRPSRLCHHPYAWRDTA